LTDGEGGVIPCLEGPNGDQVIAKNKNSKKKGCGFIKGVLNRAIAGIGRSR